MSTKVVKKSIALSVDVSVDVNHSANQNTRHSRKRRQTVKRQYYHYSDSDNSDIETEESRRPPRYHNKHRSNYHSNKRAKMTDYQKRPERQLMRPWLVDQVNQGDIPGLQWLDTEKTLIKIPWTHASRHGWNVATDSDLFRRWAKHTGKYSADPKDKNEDGNPKKWKANFRCAMNSLPDIREEKNLSQKKGTDAYKIYKLLEEQPRGQNRKKPRTSSESSDTDQHYKKYVTKADRLERHKSVKDKIRQTIQQKQTVKVEREATTPMYHHNNNINHYGNVNNIPLPVTCSTITATSSSQPHDFSITNYRSYMSSDSDDNCPMRRPSHLPVGLGQEGPVCMKKPRYTMTQSVEKEVEIRTTEDPQFLEAFQQYEHSYAVTRDNTIPSSVVEFETEPDSDYGSTSPTSSQGSFRESHEEKIAQCISDMENDYMPVFNGSHNASKMFSPSTPNMNQEPMFCTSYGSTAHVDPQNNIYKRSESMELYSVPGSAFDQSLPMTGDTPIGAQMQMDSEPSVDRQLMFSQL